MAFFRAIFCGVVCALIFCDAGLCAACGPYLATTIANYKSGDVSRWLQYDCVSDNAKWQISGTPLEWAIGGAGVCPGNYNAVKAILEKQPDLANTSTYDKKKTMLGVAVSSCCDTDYEQKCGKNPQDKIAKLLIDNGADVNAVIEVSPGNAPKQKRTLLDFLRAQQQYSNTCERSSGKNTCPAIEKLLIAAGAKTYAELSGQTKSNSVPATSATQVPVPQTQSPETAKTVNTEQTVKTNAAEPVAAQASVVSMDNGGSDETDAGAVAVSDAIAVSTTITPQSEKGNTTEKDSEVKVEQVSEKEENSSDAEESPVGSDAGNKGEAPIAVAAVRGRIASVHNGVIQQNIDAIETKCRNPDWKLFNDGQYDAYCEEPPQLGASMVRQGKVSCSEEELNSINAVMGTKNSKGICEPIVCKIDYEIKDNTCVKQECTKSQLNDLNAASGVIENEVCIPKDCLTNFKLVGGKCVDAAELEKQMQDAEDDYKRARDNETSMENRLVSAGTMAATGIGGMELARGLAEQAADKNAEADMAAYMETFQCKIGDTGDKINGGDMGITTPGANQLIDLYQSYVDLAASLKTRKADLGIRAGIESDVVLDKSVVGLYDDKGNGVQNGTYASLYRAAMGNQTDIDKLAEQSDATTRRVGIGGTVAGAGAIGGAYGNIKINGDSVDSDSSVLNQAAGLFLGK